jgi:hypothetical protein
MTPIQLKQVVDCMGATVRNDERQPISDPPQPESSRWTGVRSTTLGARSRVRLGSDIFVASRATFR